MQNIRTMFESATLKMTIGYLAGIMFLSILFSVLIYNSAVGEVEARLGVLRDQLQDQDPQTHLEALGKKELGRAEENLFMTLLYLNILILGAGGVLSYIFARRTLQPIEAAHEAQVRFTSDASHELRTPLAVMKTEITVALQDPKLKKSEMKELLESNLEEVNRISKLTHVLLQIARLEDASIDVEEFALNDVVTSAIKQFPESMSEVTVKLPKKPLLVEANRASIEELTVILLDNALKYRYEGSRVEIRLARKSGKQCLYVTNQGEGIPKEEQPNIFRRFYRIESSRSQQASALGYGLGLSLAKKIVDLHRGELLVDSIPKKTTTFTVRLARTQ